MRKVNNTPWIAGTVVVSLIIIAVGYFFGISPKLDDAEDLNEQAESQESLNSVLEMKVIQLRADFAKLDEYREEIASYEIGIPTELQVPDFLRITDDLANEADVVLTNTTLPKPEFINIPSELESTIDVTGLVLQPIEFEIVGSYEDIFSFIDAMQQDYHRHVLIRDIDLNIEEFDVDDDQVSFVFEMKLNVDMYAMVKGDIPDSSGIDYDIPGVTPKGEDASGDDAADSDETDSDDDLDADD